MFTLNYLTDDTSFVPCCNWENIQDGQQEKYQITRALLTVYPISHILDARFKVSNLPVRHGKLCSLYLSTHGNVLLMIP